MITKTGASQRVGLFGRFFRLFSKRNEQASEDARDVALIEAAKNDEFEPLESVLAELERERELSSRPK